MPKLNPIGRDKRPLQIRSKTPGTIELSDEDRAKVWRMSVHDHLSIAQIAEKLGKTVTAVHAIKHKAWEEVLKHTTDSTDIYRADLSEKLLQLVGAWWSPAQHDIQAATFVANAIDKLAKINGCHVTKIADANGKPLQLIPEHIMMLIATGGQPKLESRMIE